MSQAARKNAAADAYEESPPAAAVGRGQRAPVFLVTRDDALWPQIGPGLERDGALKQVDTIDELKSTTPPGQAGIILWDARESSNRAQELAGLQLHSERLAIIVLDAEETRDPWPSAVRQRRIVALVPAPFEPARLLQAFVGARDEYRTRNAVLGAGVAAADVRGRRSVPSGGEFPWVTLSVGALGVACAAALGYRYLSAVVSPPAIRVAPAPATPAAAAPSVSAASPTTSASPIPASAAPTPGSAAPTSASAASPSTSASPTSASAAPPTSAASPSTSASPTSASAAPTPASAASPTSVSLPSNSAAPLSNSASSASPAASPLDDEQVDALLDRARQAMLDRHFLEPAGENALALYQNVLTYEPNNGEARQGLQRLAQILFARVRSYLDEHRFDAALESLETARNLSPDDPKLKELDAKVEALKAELGPEQIEAAINASNFERATQLLEDAASSQSLRPEVLAQLREELKRRQQEALAARLLAAQNLGKRLMRAARAALGQQRLGEVPRLIEEARSAGVAPKLIAGLQHDFEALRSAQARDTAQRAQILDLAQKRLAQDELIEPSDDSALFYIDQLRAADPASAELARASAALQSALIADARSTIAAGDIGKAEALIKAAAGRGTSAELDALESLLAQQKLKLSRDAAIASARLTPIKPMKLDYPKSALAKGTEGWVDLAFEVTSEGKVTNISVIDASPHDVFESAAKRAVSRVRYKPVLIDGQAADIRTTLHVVFRMDQP